MGNTVKALMNHFSLFMLCVFPVIFCDVRRSMIAKYRDLDLAPDSQYLFDVIQDTPRIDACLIHCSKKIDCLSIVLEGTTCSLYKTPIGHVPLTPGQKAVGEVTREAKYKSSKYRRNTLISVYFPNCMPIKLIIIL